MDVPDFGNLTKWNELNLEPKTSSLVAVIAYFMLYAFLSKQKHLLLLYCSSIQTLLINGTNEHG